MSKRVTNTTKRIETREELDAYVSENYDEIIQKITPHCMKAAFIHDLPSSLVDVNEAFAVAYEKAAAKLKNGNTHENINSFFAQNAKNFIMKTATAHHRNGMTLVTTCCKFLRISEELGYYSDKVDECCNFYDIPTDDYE